MDHVTSSIDPTSQTPTTLRRPASKSSTKQPAFPHKNKHERPKATKVRLAILGAKIKNRTKPASASRISARKTCVKPMVRLICVHVKNRLGMYSEVLCSSSKSIGYFKKCLAFNIGIKPETILLKWKGMKLFNDALMLADYEIGVGLKLYLEIVTTG